jgi:hypothetical protein
MMIFMEREGVLGQMGLGGNRDIRSLGRMTRIFLHGVPYQDGKFSSSALSVGALYISQPP